jgi:hypothetical protein
MTWLDENPNCARTRAAFRLVGDAPDPDAVTRLLAVTASLALTKGQELSAGHAAHRAVNAPESGR